MATRFDLGVTGTDRRSMSQYRLFTSALNDYRRLERVNFMGMDNT